MKLRCGLSVVVLFTAAIAYATNETALIPRAVLFAPPDRSAIKLSADGSRIAFVSKGSLWIASVRDVTKRDLVEEGPVATYEWAFDNRHIVYTKQAHVFALDLDTRKSRDLGA